jgi:hypothetical protein
MDVGFKLSEAHSHSDLLTPAEADVVDQIINRSHNLRAGLEPNVFVIVIQRRAQLGDPIAMLLWRGPSTEPNESFA